MWYPVATVVGGREVARLSTENLTFLIFFFSMYFYRSRNFYRNTGSLHWCALNFYAANYFDRPTIEQARSWTAVKHASMYSRVQTSFASVY